jgi:hypothetical protein
MGASILEDFKRFKIAVQISHRTGTLEDGTILLAVADPARVVDEVKPFLKTCDMLEFVTIHIVEIEAVVRNRQVFPES